GLRRRLIERPGLRQFVKFCIVGASSTAIYYVILAVLYSVLRLDDRLHAALAAYPAWQALAAEHKLGLLLAASIAFVISLSNGFYWNRRWTFTHARSSSARRQYIQFALVNVVGLVLNLLIISLTVGAMRQFVATLFLADAASTFITRDLPAYAASAVATFVVMFWNFLA